MEPDVSIETTSMIRVAILPIGTISPSLLSYYTSLLTSLTKISLSTISSFYTEHQKSPFSHQPWDSGSLRFKFMLSGSPPSPWEDFQPHRQILCVIGICHCPSSLDIDDVADQFSFYCRSYSSALVTCCFDFCPGDSQVAQLYLQQDNQLAAMSAMQVLSMTTKAYRVQSKASGLVHSPNEPIQADGGESHHHSVVSLLSPNGVHCRWLY